MDFDMTKCNEYEIEITTWPLMKMVTSAEAEELHKMEMSLHVQLRKVCKSTCYLLLIADIINHYCLLAFQE